MVGERKDYEEKRAIAEGRANGACVRSERFSPKGETNACAVCPVPEGALRGFVLGR